MRRAAALFLALFLLALPAVATAQSAGDEQYADPFGQAEEPSDSQDQPAPEPQPEPTAPAAPAAPAEQALASQQTQAPTLPATGIPAHLLASMGALLLASGALLRRRAL